MRSVSEKSMTVVRAAEPASAPPKVSWVARCWTAVCRVRRGEWRRPTQQPNLVLPFWDRDAAFMLALAAIRQNELGLAERELTRGDGDAAVNDARCLNLLGVVHECRGYRRRARHCYMRAGRLDRSLEAPTTNLRRYYELTSLGNTRLKIALGDETDPQS